MSSQIFGNFFVRSKQQRVCHFFLEICCSVALSVASSVTWGFCHDWIIQLSANIASASFSHSAYHSKNLSCLRLQLCFWSVSRTFHFFAILIFKFIFFSCFYWCFPRIFWVDLISFIPYDCYYSAWMTFHNAQYPRFEIFEESNFKPFNNTVCLQFLRSQYFISLCTYGTVHMTRFVLSSSHQAMPIASSYRNRWNF